MTDYIPELELNFSNVCWANCFMCANPHGSRNEPFMRPPVFHALNEQLKDVKVGQFQTSGNGECLLNPNYIGYLMALKKGTPETPRWCYNNFSLMTEEKARIIINNHLIDKMHTRVESLDPDIMEKSSRLNPKLVFHNIKEFMRINNEAETPVHLTILYNNPLDYYNKCRRVFDKSPQYWPWQESKVFKDEEQDIKNYFQPFSKQLIDIFKIDHCLWAERESVPPNPNGRCPKMSILKSVLWISPNGDCQACCYDDRQTDFKVGNIMQEHIRDIWNGQKRKQVLQDIEDGKTMGKYPCVDPRCCDFHI